MDTPVLRVFLAVVIGVALIGFLRATSDDPGESAPWRQFPAAASTTAAAPARSYTELRTSARGEGSGWEADLAELRAAGPGRLDPVDLSGADKAEDLAERASRRAYDGAPPRIPHRIRQDSAPECLTCHGEGVRIAGRLATPVSHKLGVSCTQCHVVEESPIPGGEGVPEDPRVVKNSFVGLVSPTAGPRASTIAPPQIPHRTWMREECDSCHGVNGRDALRAGHPWRESCEQCHTAALPLQVSP